MQYLTTSKNTLISYLMNYRLQILKIHEVARTINCLCDRDNRAFIKDNPIYLFNPSSLFCPDKFTVLSISTAHIASVEQAPCQTIDYTLEMDATSGSEK